jgi:hypothetical protein
MTVGVVLKSLKDSRGLNETETRSRMISIRSYSQQADKKILWYAFTTNKSPKVERWISISVLKFWSDWDSPISAGGQRNGNFTSGLCITIMHSRTQVIRLRFFGRSYISVAHEPPNYSDMSFCDLQLFPKIKMAKKKRHGHHQREYAKHLRSFPKYGIKIVL